MRPHLFEHTQYPTTRYVAPHKRYTPDSRARYFAMLAAMVASTPFRTTSASRKALRTVAKQRVPFPF